MEKLPSGMTLCFASKKEFKPVKYEDIIKENIFYLEMYQRSVDNFFIASASQDSINAYNGMIYNNKEIKVKINDKN
jgi:hypothetical protein